MKIRRASRPAEHASVLIVTLAITVMFGMFLFYYLNLVRTQDTLVVRSQAWNGALDNAEAGVEEALAQLNPGAPQPVIDRTANGWGAPVNGLYGPVTRALSNSTYSVVYTTDTYPIIYSTGLVSVASLSANLTRVLRITTTNAPLFTAALVAINNINLAGNGVTVNSFNSADPNLSTNGRYDSSKTSTNGDVASVNGIVNVANAQVYGDVLLGPTGTDSISANGLVTGNTYNDFNINLEDVVVPQTNWGTAWMQGVPVTIDGVSYQYVFDAGGLGVNRGGYYAMPTLASGANVYIGTNTQVTLLINGNASPGAIRVAGSGSTAGQLTLYMNGASFTLGGASTIDSQNALGFAYYGTTNNTKIDMGGNASFTGTIYAPEAQFKLGGGGNSTYDCVGAIVVGSAVVNGHFNFHFDENLITAGPKTGYVARSWEEL